MITTTTTTSVSSKPYDPSAAILRRDPSVKKYTVLEEQVLSIKQKHPDTLLVVHVGYKFRMFGQDAIAASDTLSIACFQQQHFLAASFPLTSLRVHVPRLVRAGYKVGIVRQTETAAVKKVSASKGPMTRELTEMFTISTLIDEAFAASAESADKEASNSKARFIFGRGKKRSTPSASSSTASASISGGIDGNGWRPSYLAAITETSSHLAVVAVQPSTGEVLYEVFSPDPLRTELDAVLKRLAPSEYLLPPTDSSSLSPETERMVSLHVQAKSNAGLGVRVERLAASAFALGNATATLAQLGSPLPALVENDSSLDEDADTSLVVAAAGALASWLAPFKLSSVLGTGAHPTRVVHAARMFLSASALSNLEMSFASSAPPGLARKRADYGSLFWVLDRTVSASGRRMLHAWMMSPLMELTAIRARQAAVGFLASNPDGDAAFGPVISALKSSPDMERGLGAMTFGRVSPRQAVRILSGMVAMARTLPSQSTRSSIGLPTHAPLLESMIGSLPDCVGPVSDKLAQLNETTALQGDIVNLFVDDTVYPELHRSKMAKATYQDQMNQIHLPAARRELGISNLEFKTVSQEEYLLEVPKGKLKSVPSTYSLVSTTKKVSRYRSPDIAATLEMIQVEEEKSLAAAKDAWQTWLAALADLIPVLKAFVTAMSELDALHSLAIVARAPNFVAPTLLEPSQDPTTSVLSSHVKLEKARHPILEAVMASSGSGEYVANSVDLTSPRSIVLTGPNMGGKSCLARSIALLVIMAQMGSYVPAASMDLVPFDAIFTRMGASDAIFKGHSTFFVELLETSHVLDQATPRSLVLLDELGRGTSTHDGVAIAVAVLDYLLTTSHAVTLFITHYPQLAALQLKYPHLVANYHMSFFKGPAVPQQNDDDSGKEDQDLVFLYQLEPGVASDSYGLNVAKLAGLSPEIRACAARKSAELEAADVAKTQGFLLHMLSSGSYSPADVLSELQRWQVQHNR